MQSNNTNIESEISTPNSSENSYATKSENQVNLTSHNLFANKKIFPLLLRFILPAILVTIFQALYVFADQIMMIKFIPQGPLNPNGLLIEDLVGQQIYQNYIDALQHIPGNQVPLNTDDLIRASVSISAPITLILNGITLLISMGVAVSYAKALGKKDVVEIEKVWSTGFIANLTVGLCFSLFILAISPVWLRSSATGNGLINSEDPAIKTFSIAFQEHQISLAQGYIYLLSAFNVIQVMTQMYYLLAQSEGRQLFISVVPTLCNVLNVVLDYVLIVFGRLALIGSALATIIGWIINFCAYLIYNQILSKQNKTYLKLNKLSFKLYKWSFFNVIVFIGLASFLRNSSYSFSNSIFQTYLVNMTTSTHFMPNLTTSPNEFQSIFGSVSPISNLALQSVWGVIQGGRTVASYKFGEKDYKSIKLIYWYVFGIASAYGILVFVVFSFGLNQVLLENLFNVSSDKLGYTSFVLRLTMIQVVFLAVGTTAQLYFQSTQRIGWSWFTSLIQNIILFIPLLFVFEAAANAIAQPNTAQASRDAMNLFVLLPAVCAILAAIINIVCSVIHMYTKLGKQPKPKRWNFKKSKSQQHEQVNV